MKLKGVKKEKVTLATRKVLIEHDSKFKNATD